MIDPKEAVEELDEEILDEGVTEEIEEIEEEGDESTEEEVTNDEGDEDAAEESETVISIADEEDDDEEPPEEIKARWVKNTRKRNKKLAERVRELEAQLDKTAQPTVDPGPKPTLADHNYDESKFDAALSKWYDDKREANSAQEEAKATQRAYQESYNAKVAKYQKAKKDLDVPDFDDAESFALDTLDSQRVAMIVSGAEKPELLMYALGSNERRVQELAKIKDPVQFAFAAGRMEAKLTVTKRTAAKPKPERRLKGDAAPSGAVGGELEKLRKRATETGDITPVLEYKRKVAGK